MQVSSIAELDTHAVIGGGKAEAFGMSESAEFFTVLSDTLYRDKIRAVAREVICNAWDAHLMVDKSDTPIEITLTETELVIKDFGPGIAHERMRPIYCIYGASTKVKADNQTGGFGLGSKAPFAYSDHFSVTSFHEGVRTVYAVSRGGEETDGKPDMRVMVQTPTTISGITVSIPIRTREDMLNFEHHIKAVVRQGGILANLNGELMGRIDYTEARKSGFALLRDPMLRESNVYVLYGAVLYPISGTNDALSAAICTILDFKDYNDRFILIAKPNTIGVTPSREALSYSDRTVKTIIELIENLKKSVKTHGLQAVKKNIQSRMTGRQLYKISNNVTCTSERISVGDRFVADPKKFAHFAASNNLGSFSTSLQRYKIAMDEMARKFKDERRLFRRKRHSEPSGHRYFNTYHHGLMTDREIFMHSSRLIRRLFSKFDLFDHAYVNFASEKLVSLGEFSNFGEASEKLIIAPTQRDGLKLARQLRSEIILKGDRKAIFVVVNRRLTPEKIEKIKEAAKALKIDVEVAKFTKRVRGKRTDVGVYYSLADVKHKPGSYTYRLDEAKSLLKANFYMPMRGGLDDLEMDRCVFRVREEIVRRYGDVALAMTMKTEAKLKAAGAKNIYDVMFEDLKKVNNTREVQIAVLVRNDGFVEGHNWSSVGRIVNALCRLDMKFLSLFFGIKVPKMDILKDAKFLIDALSFDINGRGFRRHSNSVSDELNRSFREAKRTFSDKILSSEKAETVFAWMKPLKDMEVRVNEESNKDDLLKILKFLKRTFSVKSEPDDHNTALEEAKEAA